MVIPKHMKYRSYIKYLTFFMIVAISPFSKSATMEIDEINARKLMAIPGTIIFSNPEVPFKGKVKKVKVTGAKNEEGACILTNVQKLDCDWRGCLLK